MRISKLIFFDNLFAPAHKLFLLLFAHGKMINSVGLDTVAIKLFGMGSIVRLAYYFKLADHKNVTLITLASHKTLCQELGIDAVFIRTNLFLPIDLGKIIIGIWKKSNVHVVDFERSSNFSSVFRIILSIGKTATSFNFENQNTKHKNQAFISLKTKSFHRAMEELFETPLTSSSNRNINYKSNVILINVNAGDYFPERKYSIEKFAEVICKLSDKNPDYTFVLTGSNEEKTYTAQLEKSLRGLLVDYENKAGNLSLKEFIEELKSCRMIITNDSGPLHLAKYFEVPTVAIWGPTSAEQVGYLDSPIVKNISLNLPCSPCFKNPKSPIAEACNGKIECLNNLDAIKVAEAAEELSKRWIKNRMHAV